MEKLKSIILFLIGLLLLIVITLPIIVHFYLTDARIKALAIPQAEKALGREVLIGALDVSFFSGITVTDFAVPAKDGTHNFIHVPKMVVKYKSMPLLMKKLMLSVNIPQMFVKDRANNLPDISSSADLKMSVDLGETLRSTPVFDGSLKIVTDLTHGELKPHIEAESQFDQKKLNMVADINIDKTQKLHINSQALEFIGDQPDVKLNITGKDINIDNLLAAFEAIKKAGEDKKIDQLTNDSPPRDDQGKDQSAKPVRPAPNPKIHGTIDILNTRYQDLTIEELLVKYDFFNKILTINEMKVLTAGGTIGGDVIADLKGFDPLYKGHLEMKDVKIEKIRTGLRQKNADLISGAMNTDITFNGKGAQWPTLGEYLDAAGTYSFKNGELLDLPILQALSAVLAMPELKKIVFDDMSGTLKMADGELKLNNTFTCSEFNAVTQGKVGLNGKLDFPVKLTLSEEYSRKLTGKTSIAKYLEDEQGKTTLQLKVGGTFKKPNIQYDSQAVQGQAQKAAKKKAMSELDRVIDKNIKTGPEADAVKDAADQLLKGLFGK